MSEESLVVRLIKPNNILALDIRGLKDTFKSKIINQPKNIENCRNPHIHVNLKFLYQLKNIN